MRDDRRRKRDVVGTLDSPQFVSLVALQCDDKAVAVVLGRDDHPIAINQRARRITVLVPLRVEATEVLFPELLSIQVERRQRDRLVMKKGDEQALAVGGEGRRRFGILGMVLGREPALVNLLLPKQLAVLAVV